VDIGTRKLAEIEVFDVHGDLTGQESEKLQAAIANSLSAQVRLFAINLDKVRWLDSAGLETLRSCNQWVTEQGGRLAIVLGHHCGSLIDWPPDWPCEMFRDEAEAQAYLEK
jgi:anti-anti-sigma factor